MSFEDIPEDPAVVKVAEMVNGSPTAELEAELNRFFRMLGFNRDRYYFWVKAKKQVLSYKGSDLTDKNLKNIAPFGVWLANFPDGKKVKWPAAAEALVRLSDAVGLYTAPVRGLGGYFDNEQQFYHCGGKLFVNGDHQDIEAIRSDFIYETNRRVITGFDAEREATAREGAETFDLIQQFPWIDPLMAYAVSGWLTLAPLCALWKWRPHLWLTGEFGSGKTTFTELVIKPALGIDDGCALYATGDTSEPGIRQQLGVDALPLLIEEREEDIASLLRYLRVCSDNQRGQIIKFGQASEPNAMACLIGTNPYLINPADRSRMTVCELAPHESGALVVKRFNELTQQTNKSFAVERSRQARLRTMQRGRQMHDVIMPLFMNEVRSRGDGRIGDQWGSLLAGHWVRCNDHVPTEAEVARLVDLLNWEEVIAERETMNDPLRFLRAALFWQIRISAQRGYHASVYQALKTARECSDTECLPGLWFNANEARVSLADNGFRLIDEDVAFNINNSELDQFYAKRFPGANWVEKLKRVPFRVGGYQRQRFGGDRGNALRFPWRAMVDLVNDWGQ
jgi:putative DNA primase/helicase